MFQSYLMGGFECSTQRNRKKGRIDVIAATRHDEFAVRDYERLLSVGMRTARDGVRWHLIEKTPFEYDFSSLENQANAAAATGIQVIWDLFHYGFPDDLDIFSPEFIARFAAFSAATVKFLQSKSKQTLYICPTNEVSFFAWIAGDVAGFYPFKRKRGDELKMQLVRATIAAIDAIRAIAPATRFVQTDPAIRVAPANKKPQTIIDAANYHDSQFHAFDILTGRRAPIVGGAEKYLDVIGINYYFNNQWQHPSGRRIYRHHKGYQPFHEILESLYRRYRRPILIAETGIENEARAHWFEYIYAQANIAKSNGADIAGLCLYPIVNHPGWDDNRHCHNGLWGYTDDAGEREIYAPLAQEIAKTGEFKLKTGDARVMSA